MSPAPAWRTDAPGTATQAPSRPLPSPERTAELLRRLPQALANNQLCLHYQPQVSLRDGRIVGVEALLRWHDPVLGPVPAQELVAVAEHHGLIARLGPWVLETACRQAATWRDQGFGDLRVHVNVSPLQLTGPGLDTQVLDLLGRTGASPGMLGLELTESALLQDSPGVACSLQALRAIGVEVAIDDFGTGYSSLSRLRELPIDLLKMDRSFVKDIAQAGQSAALARAIVQLAHGMHIRVLAEGVETTQQATMLADDGCDLMQGFLFSQALPPDELSTWLQADRRLPLPGTQSAGRRPTLLLVDDEAHILSALRRLLRRDGYDILTADSGEAGLALLREQAVDVIVTDQRMPGMSGVDFLRQARALRPETVRMTLSGFTDLQSIIDAVNEGAVYKFLTKPWDDERLRAHVAQAFAHKHMADENLRLNQRVTQAHAQMAVLNQRLSLALAQQQDQAHVLAQGSDSMRALVDALPLAIVGVDPNGMLAYLNAGALRGLPDAAGQLGDALPRDLAALLDRLRAQPADSPALTHGLSGSAQAWQAWLCHLPSGAAAQGELLVLAPQGKPT